MTCREHLRLCGGAQPLQLSVQALSVARPGRSPKAPATPKLQTPPPHGAPLPSQTDTFQYTLRDGASGLPP